MYTRLFFYYHCYSHVNDKKVVSRILIIWSQDFTEIYIQQKYSKCLQIVNSLSSILRMQGRDEDQKKLSQSMITAI